MRFNYKNLEETKTLPPLHFHITELVDVLDHGKASEVIYNGRLPNGKETVATYILDPLLDSYQDIKALLGLEPRQKVTTKRARKLVDTVVTYTLNSDGEIELEYLCVPIPYEFF